MTPPKYKFFAAPLTPIEGVKDSSIGKGWDLLKGRSPNKSVSHISHLILDFYIQNLFNPISN